jgi:16S rRNA processing protein RimM
LIGLRVLRASGEEIGRLSEVLRTGSNDVYVVQGSSGQLLLPALREVVRAVDLVAGTMIVEVPAGLE